VRNTSTLCRSDNEGVDHPLRMPRRTQSSWEHGPLAHILWWKPWNARLSQDRARRAGWEPVPTAHSSSLFPVFSPRAFQRCQVLVVFNHDQLSPTILSPIPRGVPWVRGPLARIGQACWRRRAGCAPAPTRQGRASSARHLEGQARSQREAVRLHTRYGIGAEPASASGRDTRFSFLSLLPASLPDRVKTLKSPTSRRTDVA
jgi:hypothetical protein